MTRDEKERRVQMEDGKAFGTYGIEIRETYLNPTYTLARDISHAISGTGLLKVFELKSSENGPSFVGRWDGGSRGSGKQERFDLDMIFKEFRIRKIAYSRRAREVTRGITQRGSIAIEDGNTKSVSALQPD